MTTPKPQALLADQKRAALALKLRALAQETRDYPLSSSQTSVWLQQELEPQKAVYNIPLVFLIVDEVQPDVLERCLAEVLLRHKVLRNRFVDAPDSIRQQLSEWRLSGLPITDLSATADEEWRSEALRRSGEQAREPMNLRSGPLLRVDLLRFAAKRHVLLMTIHHIVFDGWSTGVLVGELTRLYAALRDGKPSPLAPLPVQFEDFVHWEQNRLGEVKLDAQLEYWKQRLAGAPSDLSLPTDFPRPPSLSFRGATLSFVVPAAVSGALKAIGKRAGATFFMTMLAAFYVWLHRLSGQQDIVLGVAFANRERRELWSLLGLFANTLPMRAVVRPEESFSMFLERVRSDALQDYAHSDVPVMHLVKELNPERHAGRSTLFQAGFDLQNSPWPSELASTITLIDGETGSAKLDLNMSLSEHEAGLLGHVEYSTDLFREATIQAYLESFRCLLASIVAEPHCVIERLQLLSADDRARMLHHWNGTEQVLSAGLATLPALFARGASRAPDAPALSYGSTRWSYRTLDDHANRLAQRLRRSGVGLESRVGLCSERSPAQLAAVLAVLKAGGAYVPLDPGLPAARLTFIIEDAGLTVVLASRARAAPLARAGLEIIAIEDALAEACDVLHAGPVPDPSNLAYVIYTSGSTGRPKGAMLCHGAVVNHALAAGRVFALQPDDRVLQFASLSFDASAEEIFPCWFHGATLVLRDEDMISTPRTFFAACRAADVTVLDLPTAYWHELVAAMITEGLSLPPKLRLVIIGGEQAANEALARWHELARPGVRLLNTYGPTEGTIVATASELTQARSDAVPSVTIGQPIANVCAYIVDESLAPVPLGMHGELLLGGAGVARGYLDRPDLTALKFIPDPFGSRCGARLYRTGDVTRRLPNGDIEYIGRADDQVKVRGVRIELGEIENVFKQHSAVREALVAVRELHPGDRRIVAYLACPSEETPTAAELREWARLRLPESMLPSALLILEALPRNASGKIDRQSLHALAPAVVDLGRSVTAPRTPSEEVVADIWCEVLRLEQVGVYDNFFELGGHSLLATQVLSRVRRAMQVEVPLHGFFEAPTIASFVQLLEANRWSAQGIAPLPIEAVARVSAAGEQSFPQSFAQQRLWFLEQLEPSTAAYNIPSAVRLTGELNLAALRASLNEIVRRHEVLRTVFREMDEQPVQCVREHLQLDIPLIDLSSSAAPPLEVQRLADEEAHRPFDDLAQGPLLRMTIVRLHEREHVVLFTMHHIVSDAWSMGVLVQELAALYRAYSSGERSPLAELKLQYADFALWQREWLSGERLERQVSYWQEQLRDMPAFLELPTDRNRAPTHSLAGASRVLAFDPRSSEAIKRRSRAENVTPFMLLLAAFKALLFRLTGQTDIVIGTPIANRHREELEPLIGFFINTLVMRTDLSGEPSFRELLGRVRETALGGYAHQDLPFEKLVEQLGPERRWSGTPLFRVMFVLQNAPMPPLELPGITMLPLAIENRTTKFDLTLEIIEQSAGLVVIAQYSADLFDAATIERLLEHYRSLLEGAVQAPERPLWQLPLSNEAQREALLAASCGPHAQWPTEQLTLHQAFSQQAQRNPQWPALQEASGLGVSYAELDAASNRLANHLGALGVGLESRVGICLPRSSRSIESVLAVLKAGAAYVPLDPDYPSERLQYLVRDSALSVLISDTRVAALDALSATPGLPIVRLDADAQAIAGQSQGALDVGVDPDNLAYLIYTSGSTGLPKGVACTHRAVLNLIEHCDAQAPLPDAARCSAWTSMSFDVSVYEIFSALLQGGCLLWVPDPLRMEGLAMSRWLTEQRIQSAYVPPFMLAELSHCALHTALPLKRLLVGVEPIELQLLLQLQDRVPGLEILNGYGPTESTVCATMQTLRELAASTPAAGKPTPIGRALANLSAYVLDAHAQPVPIGMTGELYLGGTGLARGYWERPDLSAERFVPDACSGRSGQRLYRTGDRVRYLPDARLEFLGRIDEQLKIRGYRIEPAEIEAALLQLPGVQRAIVLARRDAPGDDKRLVAYVEHEANASLTAAGLRQDLKQRLPDFMLPAAFVLLPALPQTPHGKIDRNALPAPLPESTHALVEPRTPLEATLCRIWADVLQRPHVGIDDNFFELGGHSLLATQVISRVRKALQLELPLHSLFEEPNIAGLARGIQAKRWGDKALLPPPLLAAQRSDEPEQSFPQSFAQQRLWFLEQLEPGTSTYNIPNAVRLLGPLDLDALQHSLQALIERHESLRSRFLLTDLGLMQLVARTQPFSIAITNLESIPPDQHDSQLQDWLRDEAQRPFDLAHGPLLRVGVLRLQPLEHIVLLTIHHIIADGWSIGVLVRELGALYSAHRDGSQSPLPPLALQTSDFSRRQHDWLSQGALEEQLAYWRKRLAGAPPLLQLPTDRPRTTERSAQGATVFSILPPELAERARELGRRTNTTLFMILLAAFKALLSRYSEQLDIVVGTPIANRQYEEVESLIGHLTNALALRTDLSGDPSFRALLGRVRETALEAYAHQDLPFEKLVEQLGAERRSSRTPLFQVMFVLQNAPMPPLQLPGIEATALSIANTTTMFDLTLEVVEHSFGLVAAIQYSTDLFDPGSVERMLAHYEQLLRGALAAPDTRLLELPLLTAAEYQQAVRGYSAAEVLGQDESEQLLHRLVERQVACTPEQVAVIAAGQVTSYAELDTRANRLAHYLSACGVGVESRVGILLSRTSRLVESVLGVLKAGAAYVPLDPSYPQPRLEYLIRDSGITVLITESEVLKSVRSSNGSELSDHWGSTQLETVVCLDAQREAIAAQPIAAPNLRVAAHNLAYVIYTSGSSGQPKGVMIEHRNASAFLRACHDLFDADELSEVLAATSLSFDLSVFEIFAPLTRGGRLRLLAQAFDLSADSSLSLINTVPSIMLELLRFEQIPPSVRTINLAGEALPLQLVRSLQSRFPRARILNLYGPSEDTTYSTYFEVPSEIDRAPRIGRPIRGTHAYVLDTALQPTPIGVAGEIYLAGAGLARGYAARPELTAEAFVPDPFSLQPGSRLYKTGDRGRRHADGNLEYLGRSDHQIKLRGCRIELAEVEAVLLQKPEVAKAAVSLRKDESGAPRLVAYIVAREGAAIAAPALAAWLRDRLPEYMVPSAFAFLDRLPITSNGKIDRNALPAPESVADKPRRKLTPPETHAELVLADIWRAFLAVDQLSLQDDFFELGGHSLLATQVLSRVRRVLQADVPLRKFFEVPTLSGLLQVIADIAGGRDRVETIAETYLRVMQLPDSQVSQMLSQQDE